MTNNKRKAIPPLTDAEEAEIQREIAADPDAPELTDEQATQRMTFAEALRKAKKLPNKAPSINLMEQGRKRPA